MAKKNLFLVMGRTCSGKDSIVIQVCKELEKKQVLSYTTRPRRIAEGNTHIFITPEEVESFRNQIIAYTKIGEFEYFATKEQIDSCLFYIVDPRGRTTLEKKLNPKKYNLVSVFISLPGNIRKERSKVRGDDPATFIRRSQAETEQFDAIEKNNDFDYLILNENLEQSVKTLINIVKYYE